MISNTEGNAPSPIPKRLVVNWSKNTNLTARVVLRTVHSLSVMLALFPGIKINLVSPPNLAMPAEVVAEVKAMVRVYAHSYVPCERFFKCSGVKRFSC